MSVESIEARRRAVSTWALFGSLTALVGLLKSGIGTWPGWDNLMHVAANWDGPAGSMILEPGQDYFLPNAGFSTLLGVIGIQTQGPWLTAHVAMAVLAIVVPFAFREIRASADRQRLLFLVFAGGPLTTVLFAWIGTYDPVCVLGGTVAVLSRSRLAQWSGWAIFAFGHWQLALVSAALVCAYVFLSGQAPVRAGSARAMATVAALGILPVAAAITVVVDGSGATTSRWDLLVRAPLDFVYAFLASMPGLLFTVLGVLWLVLLRPATLREPSTRALVGLTVLATLTIPFVAVDQTRVISIAILPMVLLWVREAPSRFPLDQVQEWWRSTWVAAVIVPVPMYVNGLLVLPGWLSFLSWRAGLGG